MSDFSLEDKFPDLRPVRRAPTMFRINGCGLAVYGRRDYDEETGTYVKTQCVCLIFIPVLAVAAYRVADADFGWYFLGRVPLSTFARAWNAVLVLALLGVGGLVAWHGYTQSADYLARQTLAEGDRLAAAGQLLPAAQQYRRVALGGTSHAGQAAAKLKELLDGPVAQAPPATAAPVYVVAVEIFQHRTPQAVDPFERGMRLVRQHAEADPRGALQLLEVIRPLAPSGTDLAGTRRQLLERVVVREPDNVEAASDLAVIYESQNQLAKCEPLLLPHARHLGTTEGARILGHILAGKGKLDEAHALLVPYTKGRLDKLHAAEANFTQTLEQVQKTVIEQLKKAAPPDFPLQRYRGANGVEREAIFNDYLNGRIKNDPSVRKATEALREEARIVPTALDLGIVLLRRAQGMADPKARQAELRQAEETFLAVRGVAGQSDQYRLFLGQVDYWLGKHREGQKLFDELLKTHGRDTLTLVEVAQVLRQVGEVPRARQFAEEAHRKATDARVKYDIAHLRSTMRRDLDDEVTWLEKANPADPDVKASLATARGRRAMREGQDSEAAGYFRQAIDLYAAMPQNAFTMNNSCGAYFGLYAVSGDREALDKGVEMLDKAVALKPSDSVLLLNAAYSLEEVALRDVIGAAIDLRALRMGGTPSALPYLYEDQAGRAKYVRRLREHTGLAKAVTYFERVTVLAPKQALAYSSLATVHGQRRDTAALRGLLQRLEAVDVDLQDKTREALDFIAGKDDAKHLQEIRAGVKRLEGLVKATRQRPKGATFAIAATMLSMTLTQLEPMNQPVDADRVVALAEEGHAAAPSSATRWALANALLFRASRKLARAHPAYAAMLARARRSLDSRYVFVAALGRDAGLRAAAGKEADVRRAVVLVKEAVARFPDDVGPWSWALLQALEPAEGSRLAQAVAHDELSRLERAVELRLSPVSATTAFSTYWAMQAAGKEAEGLEVLRRCAARGVPMPFDLQPPAVRKPGTQAARPLLPLTAPS